MHPELGGGKTQQVPPGEATPIDTDAVHEGAVARPGVDHLDDGISIDRESGVKGGNGGVFDLHLIALGTTDLDHALAFRDLEGPPGKISGLSGRRESPIPDKVKMTKGKQFASVSRSGNGIFPDAAGCARA